LKIHYLQHVAFEGPGAIAAWAKSRHHALVGTSLFRGEQLPSAQEFDLLIVMGGPMSVRDDKEYCWLKDEMKLIDETLHAGKKVLGVCLGAQLLAHVLGSRVYPAREKEIGWFPVRMRPEAKLSRRTECMPDSFLTFHWHGETFDLPTGATHLAETTVCPNQAFEHGGQAIGLQFHLEVTPDIVRELVRNCGNDTDSGTPGIENSIRRTRAATLRSFGPDMTTWPDLSARCSVYLEPSTMIQLERAALFLDELDLALQGSAEPTALAMQLIAKRFTHYKWVGVYWLMGDTLVLGPYVGDHTEHSRIPVGQGVCGTAVAEGKNQIVQDVRQIANYLSCSLRTHSEIVVLIRRAGRVIGQIDADADEIGAFDQTDESLMMAVADRLSRSRTEDVPGILPPVL
jgi:GMP synthase-like glutamine amidotransferase/putative methionine-R-sulfoxide reductase with GAF domain